jgi:hypothetical protein
VPVVQGPDGPLLAEPQPEQFIAADGWFTLLGLGFGVLAALGVWWVLRRHRGVVGLVAVAAGALGAALVAWWLGRHIGLDAYERWRDTAAVGATSLRPADLRAGGAELLWGFLPVVRGDLLVPAFAAAVTYTLLAGWSNDPGLDTGPPTGAGDPHQLAGGDPAAPAGDPAAPAGRLSWGSPAPPAPTAAPAPPAPGAAAPPPD